MSSTKLNRIVVQHLDGARKGDFQTFEQTTVSIGRSGDCDLVFVNEKSTSIHHAVLRQREDSIELIDTQSTNGTFLNDARIERAVLKDGDVVRFGVLGPTVKIGLSTGHELQHAKDAQLLSPDAPGLTHVPGFMNASAFKKLNEAQNTAQSTTLTPAATRIRSPLRNWRFVRTALVLYSGGSVAAIGVFNTVIDRYKLDVRWFSVFLVVMGGGMISTLVEAWYRGTPGTQKFQWWEVIVHASVTAACLGLSVAVWRA